MNQGQSQVAWHDRDGIAVVTIHSRGTESNTWSLQETMRAILQKEYTRLIIDFSECTYLASAGWVIIAAVADSVAASEGSIVLCGVDPRLRTIISTINLDGKLRICETLEEALQGGCIEELAAGA